MTAAERPFRVIIVGGGLVALTAAHILAKTDIDFVILEQHDNLLPEIGSLLNLWPPTFRLLDQLGLLDAVQPVLNDIKRGIALSADDATFFADISPDSIVKANHGYGIKVTHRPRYIEVLYRTLPDDVKKRIKLRKRVVDVKVSDDGVSVECDDGTITEGSIIIGADGVRSRVRECMQAMAAGKPVPDRSTPPKSPYITTYRMLFANIPIPPGLETNTNYECASERVSTQILTGDSQAWAGIYEALDEPTSKHTRYTNADKDKILEKWGHLYIAPGWRVRDVYATHVGELGLINLEEGLVDKWFWKRIVLVSDAVRKLEPHAGLGYNSGVADMVVLVNKLRRLLQTEPSPTTKSLEAAFASYQKDRMKDEAGIHGMSARRARMTGWLTPMNRIMFKYIAPWFGLAQFNLHYVYAPIVSRVPVLEWVKENSLPQDTRVPYIHYPVLEGPSAKSSRRSSSGLSVFTGTIVLAAIAAVGFQYYRRIY